MKIESYPNDWPIPAHGNLKQVFLDITSQSQLLIQKCWTKYNKILRMGFQGRVERCILNDRDIWCWVGLGCLLILGD